MPRRATIALALSALAPGNLRGGLRRRDRQRHRPRGTRLRDARPRRSTAPCASTAPGGPGPRRCWAKSRIAAATPPPNDTSARRSKPIRETCICWARTAIGSSTSSAPADVIALVGNETRVDALLLRLALAQRAARRPEAAASIEISARALRGEPRPRRHGAPARERALRARAARRRAKRTRARARQLESAARAGGSPHPRRSGRRRRRCCGHGHRQAMAGRDGIRISGGRHPGRRRHAERRNETLDRDAGDAAGRVSSAPAHAHKPSDSYLTLTVEGDRIDGQWDIALRDLDFALGLDANQDDAITWGEVKARHADIAAYALTRLRLGGANAPCPAQVTRAPDRRAQRRRLRRAALHRDLRRRAQSARRRLSPVLRSRPSASRPDTPRARRQDARRHLHRRHPGAIVHARRVFEMGTVRRLRQRGRLAHLDGLRPRPLPAVAAAAGGAGRARGASGRRVAAGRRASARRSSTSSRS